VPRIVPGARAPGIPVRMVGHPRDRCDDGRRQERQDGRETGDKTTKAPHPP
jgi:hypothetical protein